MQNDPENEQQSQFLVEPASSTDLEDAFDESVQSIEDVAKALALFQLKVLDAARARLASTNVGCRGDAPQLNVTFAGCRGDAPNLNVTFHFSLRPSPPPEE